MKVLDIIERLGATLLTIWSIFELIRCIIIGGDMIIIPIGVFIMCIFLCWGWWNDILSRKDNAD